MRANILGRIQPRVKNDPQNVGFSNLFNGGMNKGQTMIFANLHPYHCLPCPVNDNDDSAMKSKRRLVS